MTLTQAFPVFDGHNDVLLHLSSPDREGGRNFFLRSESGHLDLPRAHQGGWAGGFFAIFIADQERDCCRSVSDEALDPVVSGRMARALMARLFRLEEESQGQLKVVRTADELSACLRDGVLASVLHFEGAEPIDPELHALSVFYRAGLRSLGLVWSRPNAFASGVPGSAFPHSPDTGPGLTDAGKELVRACNRLGIMLNLSHLNEQGFWDVARLSSAPLVATHSNAHAICPTCKFARFMGRILHIAWEVRPLGGEQDPGVQELAISDTAPGMAMRSLHWLSPASPMPDTHFLP